MELKFDFNIDMLLDAKLKLQLITDSEMLEPIYSFCTPNLEVRNYEDWRKYEPVAIDTPLHFVVEIDSRIFESTPLFIDLHQSTLELGYIGMRYSWVGPGRLFNYDLSRYFPDKGNTIPLNRKI